MNKVYYVYVDFTDNGVPFYVGKGLLRRVLALRRDRNKKHTWVRKNFGQHRLIIGCDENESFVLEQEVMLIDTLETFNSDYTDYSDVKCNLTRGGEGSSGHIPSDKTRQIRRESMLKFYKSLTKPITRSDESRRLMSESAKKRIRTIEFETKRIEAVKKATLGIQRNEEVRKKISLANTGHRHSEETKRKIREKRALQVTSLETCKKMSESQRKRWTQRKQCDMNDVDTLLEKHMKKVLRMSDQLLGRIISIIQEAIITGTDVLDLFREMQMRPADDDPHQLILTEEYTKKVDEWHKQIEETLVSRKKEVDENQAGRVLIQGAGDIEKLQSPVIGTIEFNQSMIQEIKKKGN